MSGVRPLAEIARADAAAAGSKGAHLGEMIRRGFPVPDGFVITTEVYASLFARPGVRERVSAVLTELQLEDAQSLRRTSERVRAVVAEARLGGPWEEAIRTAYRERGQGAVAVRSSATAEDLPNASFAGQQATYLNVRGPEALLAAVEQCWLSLFSERAIYYRHTRGFEHTAVQAAVVVQDMVQARAAGVAFSMNPTTGSRDELLIEASFGLGASVVAGEVTPDLYVIEKATGAYRQRVINEQSWGYYCNPEGGTLKCPVREPGAPVLADGEVRTLATLVREVEAHFGCPQDVEWAIDEEARVLLLQARPITAWT